MTSALPVGARVVHIGPQKTGTTTLQGAFHRQREELERHGVHYAGKARQARLAAAAVVHGKPMPGYPRSTMRRWPELVKEVTASRADRVLVSAEMFANARAEAIRSVAAAFGPATEIVITVRPLAKLLPSQWQQYVQSSLQLSYGDWLRAVLDDPPDRAVSPGFWHRHHHDKLAERWARVVGPDHVTVVILREGDRGMNLRVFEQLLALPEGLLVPDEQTNRSFTVPEIELLRELNRQFFAAGHPRALYERHVRYGLDGFLKERVPAPGEPPIVTPGWALQRADEIAQAIQDGLRGSGVRIVGDVEWLRLPVPADAPEEPAAAAEVSTEIAARAVLGALEATVISPKNFGVPYSADIARRLRADGAALLGRLRRSEDHG